MMDFMVLVMGIALGVVLSMVLMTVIMLALMASPTIMAKLTKWYMNMMMKSIENAGKVFDEDIKGL